MDDTMMMVLILLGALAFVFLIRIYIAYRMAKNRHRDALGWVLLSFFFSPLLTWIILLIVGDDKEARYREERLDHYEREEEYRNSRSYDEDNTYRES